MAKGQTVESTELSTVALMREMGWTYEQYMEQPNWVLLTLNSMLKEEYYQSKKKK